MRRWLYVACVVAAAWLLLPTSVAAAASTATALAVAAVFELTGGER